MNKIARFTALFSLPLLIIWGFLFFAGQRMLTIHTGDGGRVAVKVELAQSPEEKIMGLMFRQELGHGRGMLFVYESPQPLTFWMKNMQISLDILFIGEDLSINHIESDVPPCHAQDDTDCPQYGSDKPTLYVLEVPAGMVAAEGIELGDRVSLPPIR